MRDPNPPTSNTRVASFTRGPNNELNQSIAVEAKTGTATISTTNSTISKGDNFEALNTVMFLPYMSNRGCPTAAVERAQ